MHHATGGQLVVLKAVLGDVCDDNTMAYGLAVVQSAFAVGNMIGPSVGGWTAFPAQQFPHVFHPDGIFAKFPALLPNIFVAIGLGVGIALTLLHFPKTNVGGNLSEENKPLLENRDTAKYEKNNEIVQLRISDPPIYGSIALKSDKTLYKGTPTSLTNSLYAQQKTPEGVFNSQLMEVLKCSPMWRYCFCHC